MESVFVVTFGDVVAVVVVCIGLLVAAIATARSWMRQSRCKHDGGVNETQACDAICRKCGKNLGFIGSIKNG